MQNQQNMNQPEVNLEVFGREVIDHNFQKVLKDKLQEIMLQASSKLKSILEDADEMDQLSYRPKDIEAILKKHHGCNA